jgi:uncharacterized RDD family membrane protein YckC
MSDGAAFCMNCGQALPLAAMAPRLPTMSMPTPALAHAAGPRMEYAGFWLRVVAAVIDTVVVGVAIVAILIPLIFLTGLGGFLRGMRDREDMNDIGFFMIIGIFLTAATLSLALTWLYHAFMESSEWQATVGKKALGLVVTDMAGQRVSFARSTGRHFGKIITNMIPAFIGYFMAGFTERKQALHDMIASCLVLRRS